MIRQKQRYGAFNPSSRALEKERQRASDAHAYRSGQHSAARILRKNAAFSSSDAQQAVIRSFG